MRPAERSSSRPTSARQQLGKLRQDEGQGSKYNTSSARHHDLDWRASWQTASLSPHTAEKGPSPITGPGYIVLLTPAPTVHSGSSEIKRSPEFKLTELPFLLSLPPVLLCHWRLMEEENKLSEASMQIVTASKSADSDSLRRRSDSC